MINVKFEICRKIPIMKASNVNPRGLLKPYLYGGFLSPQTNAKHQLPCSYNE